MTLQTANFARVTTLATAAIAAGQVGSFLAGRAMGRRDTIDVVWGPGLSAIALVGAAAGTGDRTRRLALAAGLTVWGGRLGKHIVQGIAKTDEEDPRYTEMLEGVSPAKQFVKLHLTQAAAQWFISLPVQVAAASGPPSGWRKALVPAGLAVMVGGMITEAVADHQKEQWKKLDADERPKIMDEGLWGWSRHPNHFGDLCVWSGVYLVAAASTPGEYTILSPAAMGYFLVVATGARRMEKRMEKRPEYREYQDRVSFFVPLPPKH